jgi:hypothetical protein
MEHINGWKWNEEDEFRDNIKLLAKFVKDKEVLPDKTNLKLYGFYLSQMDLCHSKKKNKQISPGHLKALNLLWENFLNMNIENV